jgi:N6-L-threonylcarbamoyladenine synthase
MRVLGIETSCDETAAAVVEFAGQRSLRLLSSVVATSLDLHAQYGGVVPEIAARSHIESIMPVIDQALSEAFGSRQSSVASHQSSVISRQSSVDGRQSVAPSGQQLVTSDWRPVTNPDPWDQIDAIAVTHGAGLGGSLLVGVMAARTLAIVKNKPLYAVNHVEGHVYANFLTEDATHRGKRQATSGMQKKLSDITYHLPRAAPVFPLLALIVSGGHSQLVLFKDHFDYFVLGRTQDDAIGEAFDKVAKMIGLPYPGGPSIAKKALEGDPYAYKIPKARLSSSGRELETLRLKIARKSIIDNLKSIPPKGYDFSFSGPKTAVLRLAQELVGEDFTFPSKNLPDRLSEAQKADIAASFQRVAVETVVDKAVMAFEEFRPKSIVIAGGVASSQELRRQLSDRLQSKFKIQNSKLEKILLYTDPKLCTDNAAMIATLGCFMAKFGRPTANPYTLAPNPNLSM